MLALLLVFSACHFTPQNSCDNPMINPPRLIRLMQWWHAGCGVNGHMHQERRSGTHGGTVHFPAAESACSSRSFFEKRTGPAVVAGLSWSESGRGRTLWVLDMVHTPPLPLIPRGFTQMPMCVHHTYSTCVTRPHLHAEKGSIGYSVLLKSVLVSKFKF